MLNTRVKIEQGTLQGQIEESNVGSYVSFKGIPYAKPPLGKLRFSAPQPPEPWQGVRDTTEHGDICLQKILLLNMVQGSEDCLYLNVYTPNTEGHNGAKYPVMVFIHGGAFKTGSGNKDMYGPEYLVNKGVILVTINYRVEILGFLCVDTEDVPGNAGLKDQVAALQWVNQNISNFGGDAKNITIFGESAGSASVGYHLFSPLSRGLFQAAIGQSGVPTNTWARDKDAVNRAFRLGSVLGKTTTDKRELIDFLRSTPAIDLLNAAMKTQNADEKRIKQELLFCPVVESIIVPGSTFLSTPINELLSNGQFYDVPLMLGVNNGEGVLFLNEMIKQTDEINEDFSSFLSLLLDIEVSKEIEEKFKQFYFDNKKFDETTLGNMINLRSDLLFVKGVYNFAKEFAKKASSPVYFNIFAYHSELNALGKLFGGEKLKLASHGDDLFYLFKSTLFDSGELDISSEPGKILQKMVTLWTNVAKYRNPTPQIDDIIETIWKPIQKDKFLYLNIGDKLELKENPYKERMDFLNDIHNQYGYTSKL